MCDTSKYVLIKLRKTCGRVLHGDSNSLLNDDRSLSRDLVPSMDHFDSDATS